MAGDCSVWRHLWTVVCVRANDVDKEGEGESV